jgi:asparagine synthase (glutamine-hydrolysing)
VPIRHYLAAEAYDWARQIITSSQAAEYLDTAAAVALLDAHKAGAADHSRRIWTILIFLLWHGIFVTGAIQPAIPQEHYPVKL